MIVTGDIVEVRQIRWADPTGHWGLVPTMGYLHEGHLSLVRRAKEENGYTAVTIFVNPTQFAPTEDLSSYPRNLERDLALLAAEEVDLVFTPADAIMYPPDFQTTVTVGQVSKPLEGTSRPTHFQGVATVVAKLFNIIQPTRAYFGQKDAQQTVVLRQMVRDLNFNVEMIICPTVREADGLAMSSRNAYLTPEQRQAATVLYRALTAASNAYAQGERSGGRLRQIMSTTVATEPLARLDYASAADPLTLQELEQVESGVLFSLAVFFGKTRLIDNMVIA
ncbi:MAG: pantoate--beta-alanine ligase [Chloroflexi bacterium]|nr:pantoate--beta-alanine ligase [Ardenticatenaceae bacterium]MBL1127988.1 pantoate--beta-alanine ligase [Chloroflexota bacterium]NOG34060.1 pantoate--beta-alanine ligase [Chloroflexota bacterium]GIK54478.1 MAG: pantothenate synthetase [Chloroflexota bacterium]